MSKVAKPHSAKNNGKQNDVQLNHHERKQRKWIEGMPPWNRRRDLPFRVQWECFSLSFSDCSAIISPCCLCCSLDCFWIVALSARLESFELLRHVSFVHALLLAFAFHVSAILGHGEPSLQVRPNDEEASNQHCVVAIFSLNLVKKE